MKAEIFVGIPRNDQLVMIGNVHNCNKPDCYYCYLLAGDKSLVLRPRKQKKVKPKTTWKLYTPEQDAILIEHIHDFHFILPGRTFGATKCRKVHLRKKHNIVAKGRWGSY